MIDVSPAFMISSPLLDEEEYADKLIKPFPDNEDEIVEKKMKLEMLDVASVFHYKDKDQDRFFDSLASIEKGEYFKLRSIQTLIDFNYPTVQEYLIKKLFIPYVVFHITFLVTIFYSWEHRFDDQMIYFYLALLASCVAFSTYFLANELRQIYSDGPLQYFTSFWNYIDTIPLFGIYIIATISLLEVVVSRDNPDDRINEVAQRIIISIVTLFMWLKFLYFFRLFDSTSYLIRAIVTVVIDMRNFFIVLVSMIVGFGNAFLVLSLGN